MVQNLLTEHFALYSPEETNFFAFLKGEGHFRKYRPRVSLSYRLRYFAHHTLNSLNLDLGRSRMALAYLEGATHARIADQDAHPDRGAVAIFVAHLDGLAQQQGLQGWLEKTPNHIYYLPEICLLVPDARFVHVIRRGEDVVASLTDAARQFPDDRYIHDFSADIGENCRRWNNAIHASLQYAQDERHLLVFYEDIVCDQERFLNRVARHLAEPVNTRDNVAQIAADSEPWKVRALGPVVEPDNKFETLFSAQERDQVLTLLDLESYQALKTAVSSIDET